MLMLGDMDVQQALAHLEEVNSAPDEILIEGPNDLNAMFSNVQKMAKLGHNPAKLLSTVGSVRISDTAKINPDLKANIQRLATVSSAVGHFVGQVNANYLRRPNQVCGLQTGPLAPGGTQTFEISPSNGQAWWRLLAICFDDRQAETFGLTSLKIGLEHVNFAQKSPTVALNPTIVQNGVPLTGFMIRESSHMMNLAPWTGQDWDNSVTITGTIANLSAAGSADAVTKPCRGWLPVQTDPCGSNYAAARGSAMAYQGNLSRAMAHYTPGLQYQR